MSKNQDPKIRPIRCAPGEKLHPEILKSLKKINAADYNGYPDYLKAIEKFFHLKPINSFSEEDRSFIAGFIEGEGSINLSAKKLATAKYGLIIDPEFSVTQVVNGIETLHAVMSCLKAGKLRHKSGANATLVVTIDNKQSISAKVIPFLKKHSPPFSSPIKKERLRNFEETLSLLENKGASDFDTLHDKILPLWDKMRMQKGQINETFPDLESAQKYLSDFKNNKS